MTFTIDPQFDTLGQRVAKIQKDCGIRPYNDTNFRHPDGPGFEFDISRQMFARVLERHNINPPRTNPFVPTPREELMRFDPPMFRDRTIMEPIRPLFPNDEKEPFKFDSPFGKNKDRWPF